jgi:transforming growth factor-beta-induced protein
MSQNIKFDGGILHLVDGVLTLPQSPITTATAAGLNSFVERLNATGLTKTLESFTDVTIFAPTDMAFNANSSNLAALSTEEVANVLSYHVVKGVEYSTGLKDGQILPTKQGRNLKVKISGGDVYINDAKVVKTDFLTTSGVIHIIDSVLIAG